MGRKFKRVLFGLSKDDCCTIKLDIYLGCKDWDKHIKAYALKGTLGHKDKHVCIRLSKGCVLFMLILSSESCRR